MREILTAVFMLCVAQSRPAEDHCAPQRGDTVRQVLRSCGSPEMIEVYTTRYGAERQEWTYELDIIVFDDGRVLSAGNP